MNYGIRDITPLTMLDYPGRTACILWSGGCNMRCRYCYNPELLAPPLPHEGFPSLRKQASLEEFLQERSGFLDGVVLSGGECSLNPHIETICGMARSLGYAVKMDTNGSRPAVVRQLVNAGLIDYVALDYKAPAVLFTSITGAGVSLYNAFRDTLEFLIVRNFPFEVRTTIHPGLLGEEDVNHISRDLKRKGYPGVYYLQHYLHTTTSLGNLQEPTRELDPSRLDCCIPIGLRNFKQAI